MSNDNLKLLLAALEVEVLQEALELYLQTRPVPADGRFEYRYRAARSVLENLRLGNREFGTVPRSDDEQVGLRDDQRSMRRTFEDQVED